uniref:Uncharacterized protein n=1 Tax=Lotus japonicus TaxID=34305 RepID=I3RZ64_LOTJA|nr:unknown [Lotus japonicus]
MNFIIKKRYCLISPKGRYCLISPNNLIIFLSSSNTTFHQNHPAFLYCI